MDEILAKHRSIKNSGKIPLIVHSIKLDQKNLKEIRSSIVKTVRSLSIVSILRISAIVQV